MQAKRMPPTPMKCGGGKGEKIGNWSEMGKGDGGGGGDMRLTKAQERPGRVGERDKSTIGNREK